jgi:PAS domain S-box-containing protein
MAVVYSFEICYMLASQTASMLDSPRTAPNELLLLEECKADAQRLRVMLDTAEGVSWHVTHVTHLSDALICLCQSNFDVALLNLSSAGAEGLEIIDQVHAVAKDLPIVVLSTVQDPQIAVQAVAKGAQDYLVKEQITIDVLMRVLRYAFERGQILHQLQAEVLERQRSEQILRLIVEGTAAVTGEAFFQALVKSLAEALEVRYALVSGCIDTPPTRVCTYAFWQGSKFGENQEYDLYGTPCEQVFNAEECQYYCQDIQALFPTEVALVEMQAESYAGIPLFSSSGKIVGHLAVLDDKYLGKEARNKAVLEIFAARAAAEIERQQVEESLRVSQDKFSKAFRASPCAISLSTLSDGRYIEVNESCLQLLGYSKNEMLGSSAVELGIWANPEDREALKERIQEQGRVANLEVELCRKTGGIFPGLISAEIIQLDDTPCLLAITTDLSLIKEANKALERLAEIGELASMIVHELRNPLTTLLMGLNSFKRLNLPERYQTYLELSLDEGERLKRLLNQILLYSKPQNLNWIPVALHSFLPTLLDSLRNMPAAHGKHLKYEISSLPAQIEADVDKLTQVVINLVTNAFEAIDEHDSVFLSVRPASANYACIEVHNGGDPIPADILPKLTKPFVSTKPNGTGLGLAIVKQILVAHGGELKIESTPATGTTISAWFPMASP